MKIYLNRIKKDAPKHVSNIIGHKNQNFLTRMWQ